MDDIAAAEVAVRDDEEAKEEVEHKVSPCEQDNQLYGHFLQIYVFSELTLTYLLFPFQFQPSDRYGTMRNEEDTTLVSRQ